MGESLGIMAVLAVVGLLAILALYRYVTQRRQMSSGRTIGRYSPEIHDGKFIFENRIAITTGGKWCRLTLTLESAETYSTQYSARHFFEKTALLVGTPYTLTLRDARSRVVHSETGSLEPFVTLLGSRSHGTETVLSERTGGSSRGTFTLLEFLPGEAGQYLLSLQITAKVETAYPGSSSTWEVLDVQLAAVEGVVPLSGTVSYPHQRVRI
ncbi:MAG: hypothetical protein AB9866_26435 [Syntrophobacteraceae bacterium]